jgi:hypothetical protein
MDGDCEKIMNGQVNGSENVEATSMDGWELR